MQPEAQENVLSLYFHLHGIMLARMLTRKLPRRGLSRLMTLLFAMQIIVGGFCLLTAEAHAMSLSVQTMAMDGNCGKSMDPDHNQQVPDHSDACYHCDQPAELSNANPASIAGVTLVLSDVIRLPSAPLFSHTATGLFYAQMPTGPPRSSSLLYTTSQRILI